MSSLHDQETRVLRPQAQASPAGGGRRADFKWLAGVLLVPALVFLLASLAFYRQTQPAPARAVITEMSLPFLSDPRAAATLERLAPDMLAFLESPAFATAVYEDPSRLQRLAGDLPDLPGDEGRELDAALTVATRGVALTSSGAHERAARAVLFSAAAVLLLTAAMAAAGRRLGRLAGPGTCLLVASLFLLLPALFLRSRLLDGLLSSVGEEAGGMVAAVARPLLEAFIEAAVSVSGLALLLALLLLAGAALGALVARLRA